MDQNIITPEKEQELKEIIIEAISNINLCLARWKEWKHRVDINDIKGLIKNWFIRTIKNVYGFDKTRRMFRDHYPIPIMSNAGFINGIKFLSGGWNSDLILIMIYLFL